MPAASGGVVEEVAEELELAFFWFFFDSEALISLPY